MFVSLTLFSYIILNHKIGTILKELTSMHQSTKKFCPKFVRTILNIELHTHISMTIFKGNFAQ